MRIGTSGEAVAWLSIEENRKAYREWLNDPVTKTVLDILLKESAPETLPKDATGRIMIELAGAIHGESIGAHRVLRRMMTMDEITEIPEDIIASYNAKQNLMDQGYTEEDADRIVEKHNA